MMLKRIKPDQKGFTLIELLIAIPIAALVMLAASGALMQLVQSGNASANMAAIRQAQASGFWVSRDALQTRPEDVQIGPSAADPYEMCSFTWLDYNSGNALVVYEVVYSLPPMSSSGTLRELRRQQTRGDESPTTIVVATNLVIADNATTLSWTDSYARTSLRFQVTSRVGQKTCVRTYQVTPRPEDES